YYDRKDPIGEPFLLLSDVEAYRAHSGFGLYPHIMTRSDGSIWGYRFNEASMDYPVMIKAPIGAESFTLGDVNLDGKVNTTDARLALRGAAKLEALTPQQILAADVNKNGKADTSDARKILRVAAKLDQF
ncbi:MAG: dockerin type I repeat-containing protein, partial [Acutalibacteraceae bacterium]